MSSNIVFLEPEFVDSLLWTNYVFTYVIVPLLVCILDEDLALSVVVDRVLFDWDITSSCDRTTLKSSASPSQSLLYQSYLQFLISALIFQIRSIFRKYDVRIQDGFVGVCLPERHKHTRRSDLLALGFGFQA